MKEALMLLFQNLFSDIKDAKTLVLRTLTMFIALLAYQLIMHQGELLQFANTFSRNTVVEQVQGERVARYPTAAKERATMLFTQSGADEVVIAEYRPRFVNNYQDLVAWEGRLNIDPNKVLGSVLDKNSIMYSQHIQGKDYPHIFSYDKWGDSGFVTSGTSFKSFEAKFIYTCPIFNLDNSYSGYIGIVYKEVPYGTVEEEGKLKEYLSKLCSPHARALGRKK